MAPNMTMVDVLCPDCHVPMLTLDSSRFLACGSCQKVWRLFLTRHTIDWARGDIRKPPLPLELTPEEIQATFNAAMEEG